MSSPCEIIKVALAKVDERLGNSPRASEEAHLKVALANLQNLWRINECDGGLPWGSTEIEPPTDEQIEEVNGLMRQAAQTTADAIAADAIFVAVVAMLETAGGITDAT